MDNKHTFEELNSYSKEQLISIVMGMQGHVNGVVFLHRPNVTQVKARSLLQTV